ncbi:hypothetical protein K0A97_02370 [Patescibacteria group bacterium]|nr:hypothetical protein [Patescibacteria group bacterium]
MKKEFLIFLIFLITSSLVLAANGNSGNGQGVANGTQNYTGSLNQNQVRVQAGTYMNQAGEQMQIREGVGNETRLQVGGVEAKSKMQIGSEYDSAQNRTKLKTQLSNGRNAEIKVMPNTASERAIERLQLNFCNSENNCSIELKEVGNGEQAKLAYEVKAQKEARVLAMFKTKMQVRAQIDAETEEVIQAKKPWWAFLATE